ncbi:CGNR zinc finger domain-containing protein [Diaminobutyricibacter tongyongensis]|uniref:CGNR zinc finger domain-containing protein n=1 Tax=Leifsonia tongyongensis TaxID=1268043 RepID=A0A6L9Y1Y6_9MICO|nr:CGNR zinc finger domain-containing protein [Diaminobutyricibacter tongyongensis]NEN07417.1 CGNR zinc finger domain-containing protein [Diaminobutyricibacter tongyongensis]
MRTNAPAVEERETEREPELGAGLLVDFLNTLDIEEGTDLLDDAAAFDAWCDTHAVSAGDRAEAKSVRDALRSFLDGESPSLPSLELETTCGDRGVALRARTAAEAAVASSVVLSIQGSMGRVRLCAAEDCRWAFYDRSKNGSRTWCSMGVCGNRQKARTYRAKGSPDD